MANEQTPAEVVDWTTIEFVDRTDPRIDASAILAISQGELSLRRETRIATSPQVDPAGETPAAVLPEGPYQPKQPNRHQFDAADIFELSRPPHPWLAGPIEKAG